MLNQGLMLSFIGWNLTDTKEYVLIDRSHSISHYEKQQ